MRTGSRLLFAALSFALALSAQSRPWNVVLIVADDLGWADLGVYGSDLHQTPNLDRLAAEGLRFTQAYASAPVCTPTRAALLTGKHPARLHMTIWREASRRPPRDRPLVPPVTVSDLPLSELTLAELLQQNGYVTAHIGKWHLGDAGHYPENHGFDIHIGGTHWGAPQTYFFPYRGNRLYGGEPRYVPGLHFGRPGEYLTDRLTDEALAVLDRVGDRPFFLNLWHYAPHTPIEGKPELVEYYRRLIRPGLRHRNAAYAAMVHSLDEGVGRIVARLAERGLDRNTLVIFTSDNGGYINEFQGEVVTSNYPLRSGKGSLYEGGIRVPLIIRAPALARPGAVSEEPVTSADLFPTVVEITAGTAGGDIDGLSLVPLLTGAASRLPRQELYFHYPHYYATTSPVSAVRARDWKLLEYLEDGRLELYNLARDPGEERNLAAEMPARARELAASLARWRSQIKAQMPAPNPRRN
jgi:arylsulfatase A-like enzyme